MIILCDMTQWILRKGDDLSGPDLNARALKSSPEMAETRSQTLRVGEDLVCGSCFEAGANTGEGTWAAVGRWEAPRWQPARNTCKERNSAKNRNKLRRGPRAPGKSALTCTLISALCDFGAKDPVMPSGTSYLQIHEIINGRCSRLQMCYAAVESEYSLNSPLLQKRKLTLKEVNWWKRSGEGCVGRIWLRPDFRAWKFTLLPLCHTTYGPGNGWPCLRRC